MKVAIVHSYYSSSVPSGENVVVDAQSAALRAAGHEVEMVTLSTDELSQHRGYIPRTAVNVATGRGHNPTAQLRAFDPDVVHVHNLFPNFSTNWLDDWAGPLVATVHNFRSVCAAGILFRDGHVCTLCPDLGARHAVKHRCYKDSVVATLPVALRTKGGVERDPLLQRADRIILLSERSAAVYQSFGLRRPVTIVPNFTSSDGFDPDAELGHSWVYIGRLTEEKGIVQLVQNWPPEHDLSVFGDGPAADAARAHAGPGVVFAGAVPRAEIPGILASSRGMVFPSLWFEGAPMTYVEALAAGRPVVAKTGNGVADDVAKSGAGAVFDRWEELKPRLDVVAAQGHAASQRARQHFDETYSVDSWVASIETVYKDAIQ